MTPPKTQTLQERFGFKDDDLKLTTHDDIMHWVHQNIETIITELFGEWLRDKWDASVRSHLKALQSNIDKLKDETARIAERSGNEDHPGDKKYFIESAQKSAAKQATAQAKLDTFTPPTMPALQIKDIRWEYVIATSKGFTIGFADLQANLHVWEMTSDERPYHYEEPIFFEIKTKLPTAGELLRQIRLYQSHIGNHSKWIVVCPDDRHAAILRDQGIYFYKSPITG